MLLAVAAGCGSHSVTPSPVSRGRQSVVEVAPTGIYFGAQVNPSEAPDNTNAGQITQMQAAHYLESQINRTLALHMEYRDWNALTPANIASDPEIQDDITDFRVPVISLQCADDIPAVTENKTPIDIVGIGNGAADADIQTIRNGLASLKYTSGPNAGLPYPVMLRWFWEFNENAYWPMPNGDPNNNNCYENPQGPAGPFSSQFTTAWDRIHGIIDQTLGVPDVTFVWNPFVDNGYDNPPAPDDYFPGVPEVDWIGFDGYSKYPTSGPPNPMMFNDVFGSFVSTYSGKYPIPIMISENASCQQYAYPYDQGSYITDAEQWLNNTHADELPGQYADVHAFMYFDGKKSSYLVPGPGNPGFCKWYFDGSAPPPAESGLQAITNMGADPNFSPFATQK